MGNIKFWLGMLHRAGLKRNDKLLVGNIDSGKAEYIDVAEILNALTADDLQEGANNKFLSPTLKQKLIDLSAANYTLQQLQGYFYPKTGNPDGFLTATSALASAKLSGIIAASLIPGLSADKITAGIFSAARIPNLDASKINAGTFDIARIPQIPASKLENFALTLSDYILKTAIGAANGIAPLNADIEVPTGYIPGLDAAKIISGIFPEERIPDVYIKLADIVDNLLSTDPSKVASANQVRVLNEKIDGLAGAKYKGEYPTKAALVFEYPEGAGQNWHNNLGGWNADVDEGVDADVAHYIFDLSDLKWVRQLGTADAETGITIEQKYEARPDTNKFQDSHKAKVESVETGATADQTGAEIKALYEAEEDTNGLTDALKNAYDSAVNWITTNGQNVLDHITKWVSPTVAGKVPVSQADGSIVWQDKTPNKFLGSYTSLANLEAAHPAANAGEHADVDAGVGTDVKRYLWDSDDAKWVPGGSGGTVDTTNLAKLDQVNSFSQIQNTKKGIHLEDGSLTGDIIPALNAEGNTYSYIDYKARSNTGGWESGHRFYVRGSNLLPSEVLMFDLRHRYQTGMAARFYCKLQVDGILTATGVNIPIVNLTSRTEPNILTWSAFSGTSGAIRNIESPSNYKYTEIEHSNSQGIFEGGFKFRVQGSSYQPSVIAFEIVQHKDRGVEVKVHGDLIVDDYIKMQKLDLSNLGEYADDAAASAGGVSIGYAYINSTTGAVHKRRT